MIFSDEWVPHQDLLLIFRNPDAQKQHYFSMVYVKYR